LPRAKPLFLKTKKPIKVNLMEKPKEELVLIIQQQAEEIQKQKEAEENQIKKFAELLKKIEANKGFFRFIAWVNAVSEMVVFVYQIVQQSKIK
jgi:hypothetical protein